MQYIPRRNGLAEAQAAMGLYTQLEQLNQAKQMNSLNKAAMARSLGERDMAEAELDKARGIGLFDQLLGGALGGTKVGKIFGIEEATDLSIDAPSYLPNVEKPDVSERDKMNVAIGAAGRQMGGYGSAPSGDIAKLREEMKKPYYRTNTRQRLASAARTMNISPKAVNAVLNGSAGMPQGKEVTETTEQIQGNSMYSDEAIRKSEQKVGSLKAYNKLKEAGIENGRLTGDAEQMYDNTIKGGIAAIHSTNSKQKQARLYNELLSKVRMLDNKWGWDMAKTLDPKSILPRSGGKGSGGKLSFNVQVRKEGKLNPEWVAVSASELKSIQRNPRAVSQIIPGAEEYTGNYERGAGTSLSAREKRIADLRKKADDVNVTPETRDRLLEQADRLEKNRRTIGLDPMGLAQDAVQNVVGGINPYRQNRRQAGSLNKVRSIWGGS